jgi:hypothetical protein
MRHILSTYIKIISRGYNRGMGRKSLRGNKTAEYSLSSTNAEYLRSTGEELCTELI